MTNTDKFGNASSLKTESIYIEYLMETLEGGLTVRD